MFRAEVVIEEETEQLAPVLLFLGGLSVQPSGRLPKHLIQNVPGGHHIDPERGTEWSAFFQHFKVMRCLVRWYLSILEDRGTSDHLGVEVRIAFGGVCVLVLRNKVRTHDIGKANAVDAPPVFKLLSHHLKGLGKVLKGGLGIAVKLVREGLLHLALLFQLHDGFLGHVR